MDKIIDVASLRKSLKINQKDMAKILGITQSQISEIERGIRPVSKKYEEILVGQFGKDICDNFRVSSQDNRRLHIKGDVSVSGNGSIQDSNKTVGGYGELNLQEHDELIRLREENKYLWEIMRDRDERIAELKERIEELKAQLK